MTIRVGQRKEQKQQSTPTQTPRTKPQEENHEPTRHLVSLFLTRLPLCASCAPTSHRPPLETTISSSPITHTADTSPAPAATASNGRPQDGATPAHGPRLCSRHVRGDTTTLSPPPFFLFSCIWNQCFFKISSLVFGIMPTCGRAMDVVCCCSCRPLLLLLPHTNQHTHT